MDSSDFPYGTRVMVDCGQAGEHAGVVTRHWTAAEWSVKSGVRAESIPLEGLWEVALDEGPHGDPKNRSWIAFSSAMSYVDLPPAPTEGRSALEEWLNA